MMRIAVMITITKEAHLKDIRGCMDAWISFPEILGGKCHRVITNGERAEKITTELKPMAQIHVRQSNHNSYIAWSQASEKMSLLIRSTRAQKLFKLL